MKRWDAQQVARAAGARLLHAGSAPGGPQRVTIDSREVDPQTLFVGLPGERVHGGEFSAAALAAGAWGVLTSPDYAEALPGAPGLTGPGNDLGAHRGRPHRPSAVPLERSTVLCAEDPLVALQQLATAWRRELGATVIGVTGSTGKTSTKDLLLALLSPQRRTVASRANFNTEIGLPIELLRAPEGTEVLILEMGMRGGGQIAELAQIAEPDIGVLVSLGPVHLELLGSMEAIAAAKSELIAALPAGGTAIVPFGEPLLEPHLRVDLNTVSFGAGGDVRLIAETESSVGIDAAGQRITLDVDFPQAHLRANLLAAVAAALAAGVTPSGHVDVRFSPGRGERVRLEHGITLIDDCYNANPMSMRVSLDELASASGGEHRRVAVLGDMLELGPDALRYHAEIGAHADQRVDVLLTVGALSEAMAPAFHGEYHHAADAAEASTLIGQLLHDGDFVLVKASNGVGLRKVCEALTTGKGT
jgi:UDP-N-acetylmuramoyl-tripeptide--D-alanyl-D-alanine ligase